jgi:hypothetical protein
MRIRFQRIAIRYGCVLFLALACFSGGCAQFNVKPLSTPLFGDDKDKPKIPNRVVAVWVDTVRYTQGEAPTRGFGGRLMFYQQNEDKPVKIDGELVVYAFDEDGRKATDPRPTRKYVFSADQIETHYSKSKVGHSYSFFVPWDAVGGVQKEISLIVRFQPKVGPVVVSEQTRHMLPGKPKPEEIQVAQPESRMSEVYAASFNATPDGQSGRTAGRLQMQTATIALPTNFGQQTPRAEIRSQVTPSKARASAPAGQALPENQEPSNPPSTDSRLSRSRLQAAPIARREHGRVPSPPRLAEWRSPGQSSPEGVNGFRSN